MPRPKKRRFTGLRFRKHGTTPEQSEVKYVGKQNVYFYNKEDISDEVGISPLQSITGAFRPQEVKLRKKIIREVKQIYQTDSFKPNKSNSTSIVSSEGLVENYSDLRAGTSVKKYLAANDGIQGRGPPKDDRPNEDKLGWLTIYHNAYINKNDVGNGLFLVLLASTLVIGLEENVSKSS